MASLGCVSAPNTRHSALLRSRGGIGWSTIKAPESGFYAELLWSFIKGRLLFKKWCFYFGLVCFLQRKNWGVGWRVAGARAVGESAATRQRAVVDSKGEERVEQGMWVSTRNL